MTRGFFAILITFSTYVHAQESPGKTNQASFYEPGKELVINTIAWDKDNLIVQYHSPRLQSLEVFHSSYSSYRDKTPNTDDLISATCTDDYCYTTVDMSEFNSDELHFIRFKDVNTNEVFFREILPGREKIAPVLVTNAFDDILLHRSFTKDTEVYFKAPNGSREVTVLYYDYNFRPADPPTGIRSRPGKEMVPAHRFEVPVNEPFNLWREGLYFVQTDPASDDGYSFRVESSPFPIYNSLDDLKECMIYISTAEEWKQLKELNSKKEFDQVWLNASGNENNAKSAIRMYYRNIAQSNKLFTSFKEGWKSDMGMIYSVFGPPKQVTRDGEEETWEYETWGEDDLRFTFSHRPGIFSPYHSILQRKKYYNSVWHFYVDKLRQGIQLNE